MTRYRIARAGARSTEQLVEAGGYGYAHSCVTSENFPVRGAARGDGDEAAAPSGGGYAATLDLALEVG